MRNDSFVYAVGIVGYGLMGLAFADFALGLQPVPADVPLRLPLAYASALLLLGAGGALFVRPWARTAMMASAVLFSVWALLLLAPPVIHAPVNILTWLNLGEVGSLALAAWLAVGQGKGRGGTRGWQVMRSLYGLCIITFGISHFVYADITATMVPRLLPAPLFWAYATGVGHLAAGLALVSGVLARLAAMLLALMMGSFAVFVQLSGVIAQPSSHRAWLELVTSVALAGAAWLVHRLLAQQGKDKPIWHLLPAQGAIGHGGG